MARLILVDSASSSAALARTTDNSIPDGEATGPNA